MQDRPTIQRSCFVCWKVLKSSMNGEISHPFDHPPSGAVVFTAYGNYGSRVFDGPRRMLEISVCDECVRGRAGLVLEVGMVSSPAYPFVPPPEGSV